MCHMQSVSSLQLGSVDIAVVVNSSDWFSDDSSGWRSSMISTWAQDGLSVGDWWVVGGAFSE